MSQAIAEEWRKEDHYRDLIARIEVDGLERLGPLDGHGPLISRPAWEANTSVRIGCAYASRLEMIDDRHVHREDNPSQETLDERLKEHIRSDIRLRATGTDANAFHASDLQPIGDRWIYCLSLYQIERKDS